MSRNIFELNKEGYFDCEYDYEEEVLNDSKWWEYFSFDIEEIKKITIKLGELLTKLDIENKTLINADKRTTVWRTGCNDNLKDSLYYKEMLEFIDENKLDADNIKK